ncbi:hypothetical protein TWF679_005846 [Orbilia oligospora]|uniref:Uncharacterized protein n=1 Tax=Orbilia oligospora TaxID=2813651 RepID=A0A8H8VLH3_ORBOL|nr:hypothetical protein TWF679_005846 [Orbilia oligospora]
MPLIRAPSAISVLALPPDRFLSESLPVRLLNERAVAEAATGDYREGDFTTEAYNRLTSHEIDYEEEIEPEKARGDDKTGPVDKTVIGGPVESSSDDTDLEERYLSSSEWGPRTCNGCIDTLIKWLDDHRADLANLSPWSKANLTNWARAFTYFSEIADTGGYDTGTEVLTGSSLPSYYSYIAQAKDTDFQGISGTVTSTSVGPGGGTVSSVSKPSATGTTSVGVPTGLGNSNLIGGGGVSGGSIGGGGIDGGGTGGGPNVDVQGGGGAPFGGTLTLTAAIDATDETTKATSNSQAATGTSTTAANEPGTDITYPAGGIPTKLINPTSTTTIPEGGTHPFSVSYYSTDGTLTLTVISTLDDDMDWLTGTTGAAGGAVGTGLSSLGGNTKLLTGTSSFISGTSTLTTVLTGPGSGGTSITRTVTVTFYTQTSSNGVNFSLTNTNANLVTSTTATTTATDTTTPNSSQTSGTSITSLIKSQGNLASTTTGTGISTPTYTQIVVRSSGTVTKTVTEDLGTATNTAADYLSSLSSKVNLASSALNTIIGNEFSYFLDYTKPSSKPVELYTLNFNNIPNIYFNDFNFDNFDINNVECIL